MAHWGVGIVRSEGSIDGTSYYSAYHDLRTRLNDVCAKTTETRKPVVLTKNGSASYVLKDSDAYEEA